MRKSEGNKVYLEIERIYRKVHFRLLIAVFVASWQKQMYASAHLIEETNPKG